MAQDPFDILTKETMDMSSRSPSRDPFNMPVREVKEGELSKTASHGGSNSNFPKGPGILYNIERVGSTFSIKCAPVDNIRESIQLLKTGEKQWRYFVTPYVELAEIICDQLGHRRYPVFEDEVCNFSDPSFSWWMLATENSIKINYRTFPGIKHEKWIKLGPLGDCLVAQKRFLATEDFFDALFPLDEFVCNDQHVFIKTSDGGKNFKELVDFFTSGEWGEGIGHVFQSYNNLTIFHYFNEVSFSRKFWLEIEKLLEC